MIENWLKRQGYTLPSGDMRELQRRWVLWYKGYVPDVHNYRLYDGIKNRVCRRRTLAMAGVICQDFGSLLINERVQISAEGFAELDELLEHNAFFTRANRLAELTMATGTGALVEFIGEGGLPVIDYIRADMIYPLSWDNERVTECAFASTKVISEENRSRRVHYVQLHVKQPGGWKIRNVMLDADTGEKLPLPENMAELSPLSPVPLFQIVRPNTINRTDPDSPLGASVFADALEQLADTDIVWDSYVNEFVLGKKRMLVPLSLSKLQLHRENEDEELLPIFDPNDTLFYVYETDPDNQKNQPVEVDMHLRIQEHDTALQRCLDLLSKKCGLGFGRYRLEDGGVKTATEVISDKSDLYQSLRRHEKTFGDAIKGMVQALAFLCGKSCKDVAIKFDDSIIEDVNASIDRCVKRVGNGLMSRQQAIMELDGVDEKEARRRLMEIAGEERIGQEAAEAAMLGGEG